jgi:hypothetical protein
LPELSYRAAAQAFGVHGAAELIYWTAPFG